MSAPGWLDAMPAIPVERGVPIVVKRESRPFGAVALSATTAAGDNNLFGLAQGPGHWPHVVDLDDPQGFGYALRWWFQQAQRAHKAKHAHSRGVYTDLVQVGIGARHLRGETTDGDRLALALACAEVAA